MFTILIGKSGCGKDTVKNELVSKMGFEPIISSTTRQPRSNEVNGVDYNFISKKEFLEKVKSGKIFEYRKFSAQTEDIYYGSELITLNQDKDYIKILDVEGAAKYIDVYGRENCFVVEIETSDKVRLQRTLNRQFGDRTINESEKESFYKKWEIRLKDDNKRFTEDETENIVNFRANNENNLKDTIETIMNAINVYDYEIQDYKNNSHLHTNFKYPLVKIGANETSCYVKHDVENPYITHSHVESLASLETY